MVVSAPKKPTTKDRAGSRTGRRSWLSWLFPIVVWQVVAILFVELVLFWAGLGEEEIFKLDPELGTTHMTNKRITWRSEGYAQSYLNEDGMREPGLTVSKPPGTYRIALLGDSMVEGFQVPIEDTFGQILQRRLSGHARPAVQVLNFGTSGYSTAQQYLQLKKQVLKYHPDLVVVCYNSRDMFENWTPADEVITNVRPMALHLPGGKLVVHSYYVQRWMRSPRAKFLKSIEWLRQNSRIWGLIAALDLDLSMHSPLYRAAVSFFTKPKKALQELRTAFASVSSWQPSFKIQTFEDTDSPGGQKASQSNARGQKAAGDEHAAAVRDALAFNSAATNRVLEESPLAKATAAQKDGKQVYRELVERTMGSLLAEMRSQCAKIGCKLAVVSLPVRSALCPTPGTDTEFNHIDYAGELAMMSAICRARAIPMLDCQALAQSLPMKQRPKLFYAMHLSPAGHKFMADAMYHFVAGEVAPSRRR
ncbi:MAG TPA: SGNH/GDSL hydrolase family protein [Candidatus Obscuribacterales bacterium]